MSDEQPPATPTLPRELPVLPLRDAVIFPMALAPLAIGQESSVRLVEDAMRADRLVVAVAQRSSQEPARSWDELHRIGTATVIHQLFRAPDGSLRIICQGLERVRLKHLVREAPYSVAALEPAPEVDGAGVEIEALALSVKKLFTRLVALSPDLPDELASAVEALVRPIDVVYQIGSAAPLTAADRQQLLELDPVEAKLRKLVELVQHVLAVREMEHRLTSETREQLSKAQRDFFLREQLKTIQRQLGEEPERAEFEELRDRLATANLPEEPRREAERELSRLERLPEASPEHGMIRTWLDWMIALPWNKHTGGAIDVPRARRVLDEDHYDLDIVKDLILEHLAVKKLRSERQARAGLTGAGDSGGASGAGPLPQTPADESRREPILCFVGPPGVGKTSLGQSIARAMGRQFVRISLGGIHDEAEVRGHRRTYIGALPGRILQAIRRADASDPVFMLDEVDKLGIGIQGDPSAALLEVLDPAQNSSFVDTYLGVAFDLSRVLFICTANTIDAIAPPLRDRMEVLTLAGYIDEEKLQIARRHLLPRALRAHGLLPGEVELDEPALRRIVREYTREAGVRNLERSISTVLRKAARRMTEGVEPPIRIGAADLPDSLGPPRFFDELAERIDRPGIATGLAYTPAGGQILFVEATMMSSQDERLILTGMLGDVMRESAQAALSYLRSNPLRLGIDPVALERKTVHIHVPAGAIPKDGPSAGVAMFVALASLASGRVVRKDLAMTGEISLRGRVLPVGGIKEKVVAAHSAGVRRILLPGRNRADLEEVPEQVRRELTFRFLDTLEDAVVEALGEPGAAREAPEEAAPALH